MQTRKALVLLFFVAAACFFLSSSLHAQYDNGSLVGNDPRRQRRGHPKCRRDDHQQRDRRYLEDDNQR